MVFSSPKHKPIVAMWLEYEHLLKYPDDTRKNRLTNQSCPQQIGDWMQRHCLWDKAPPMDKLSEFGALWKGWWTVLQPEWCVVDSWPLAREGPVKEGWENLMKGGGEWVCACYFESFMVDDEGERRDTGDGPILSRVRGC